MSKEKSYHFDMGDSNSDVIGLCARVDAESEEQALSRLQDFLAACEEFKLKRHVCAQPHIEYVNVYIAAENITVKHIDEVDDGEEEESGISD